MRRSGLINQILTLLVIIVGLGLLFYSIAFAGKSEARDAEKSLDIERHGNEPLEFVDLKVSGKSLKSNIKVKFRSGDDGFDNVKFHDTDDWEKRLQVRLRNTSGKTIVGFQAYLYLKPTGSQVLFSATLRSSKRLEETSLAPGDEIEAEVDDGSWQRAVSRVMAYGCEVNSAEVSLSVGIVGFSDGLQWHKGHTLRIDPDNPNRHIPLETKKPPGTSRLYNFGEPHFLTTAFKSNDTTLDWSWSRGTAVTLSPGPPQASAKCVFNNGSYSARIVMMIPTQITATR